MMVLYFGPVISITETAQEVIGELVGGTGVTSLTDDEAAEVGGVREEGDKEAEPGEGPVVGRERSECGEHEMSQCCEHHDWETTESENTNMLAGYKG